MKTAFTLLAVAALPSFAAQVPEARQVVDKYCVTCHSAKVKAGGLALDTQDWSAIPLHSEVWEKVVQKLRTRTMPPAGMPRPDAATYHSTASWIEAKLDSAPAFAGRPVLHRLNRTEYANAIHDLLDLKVDASALLPPD